MTRNPLSSFPLLWRGFLSLVIAACFASSPSWAELGDELLKLIPQDTAGANIFGTSVGLSGNIAIVGAPFDSASPTGPTGATYLYDATTGDEIIKLLPSDVDTIPRPTNYGVSVDIDGDYALVGARRDASGIRSSWAYLYDVSDPNNPLEVDIFSHAGLFGQAVAIHGNHAIVGARLENVSGSFIGSAYLYEVDTQTELFRLNGSGSGNLDLFGTSVDVSDTLALVGSPSHDFVGGAAGAAYLFDIASGDELARFFPDDPNDGDNFGAAAAISGNLAVVTSPLDDEGANNSGAAYVFDVSDPNNPVQLHKLLASAPEVEDRLGSSVDIMGDYALIGRPGDNEFGGDAGAAFLFDLTTGEELAKMTALDANVGDRLGSSVALFGNKALVGSPRDGDNGSGVIGSAYIFGAIPEPQALLLFSLGIVASSYGRLRRS